MQVYCCIVLHTLLLNIAAPGATIDPVLKAKIEEYMSKITAHLLHTCVSYELWDEPEAVADESKVSFCSTKVVISCMQYDHLTRVMCNQIHEPIVIVGCAGCHFW